MRTLIDIPNDLLEDLLKEANTSVKKMPLSDLLRGISYLTVTIDRFCDKKLEVFNTI